MKNRNILNKKDEDGDEDEGRVKGLGSMSGEG